MKPNTPNKFLIDQDGILCCKRFKYDESLGPYNKSGSSCLTCKFKFDCELYNSMKTFGKLNSHKETNNLLFTATFLSDDNREYTTDPFRADSWNDALFICTHTHSGDLAHNGTLLSLSLDMDSKTNAKKKHEIWYPLECNGVYHPYLYAATSCLDHTKIRMTKKECLALCRELNKKGN